MEANRSAAWKLRLAARVGLLLGLLVGAPGMLHAQAVVPGSGQRAANVGDDFENPKWIYHFNLPKSSSENDQQERQPGGGSANGRWLESSLRGQPDVIERVPTPEGGIPGSQGALLLRSQQTGVPGSFSGKNQQDDLLANVAYAAGPIPVSWSPSVVVRVYLPPWDQWDQRTGNSFGFRAACQAYKTTRTGRRGRSSTKLESYWPGFFIYLNKGNGRATPDSARLLLRAGPSGQDFWGPEIKQSGWWTLGMSFSSDGQVHYYAHAGVDDLTAQDHIASQYPYGFRCERLTTFFFNIVSADDGSWSTPWVIDDPTLYYFR